MDAPRPASCKRRPLLVAVGCWAAFVCALLLVAAVFNALAPFPEVPDVAAKFAHFQRHKAEYDTLFIGSSRFLHQIAPDVFDGELQRAGFPSHSFNFGIDGMFPPETCMVLERLLAGGAPQLKRVFIELAAVELNIDRMENNVLRSVYWCDGKRTLFLMRRALKRIKRMTDLGEGCALLALHARVFFSNFTCTGRGPEFVRRLLHPGPTADATDVLGERGDGYLPFWEPRWRSQSEWDLYTEELARFDPTTQKAYNPGGGLRELMEGSARAVEAVGARPFFVIAPGRWGRKYFLAPETAGRGAVVFAFNDPVRYRQFYDPRNRADRGHLVQTASEEFTRTLARQVVAHLNGARGPSEARQR